MAHENNEGIAYLMALKRSASADQATAPAGVATPNAPASANGMADPGTGQLYGGAEKRRSPRYRCEGSVEMCEESCEVHTWATFTDISLHGCYVEAQATFPAGTNLFLKLEVNGIKVQTKGTVRVNYPYLGMGIAFTEMSEQERARLRVLVSSIARPVVIMGPGLTSASAASEPLPIPVITQPEAAIRALAQFFESRPALMRADFLRILRTSQTSKAAP